MTAPVPFAFYNFSGALNHSSRTLRFPSKMAASGWVTHRAKDAEVQLFGCLPLEAVQTTPTLRYKLDTWEPRGVRTESFSPDLEVEGGPVFVLAAVQQCAGWDVQLGAHHHVGQVDL
jgi:hypothetical protein